jgi:hypothetical protein
MYEGVTAVQGKARYVSAVVGKIQRERERESDTG